jgi:hypothetical protein
MRPGCRDERRPKDREKAWRTLVDTVPKGLNAEEHAAWIRGSANTVICARLKRSRAPPPAKRSANAGRAYEEELAHQA